jgi:hypothetical protein
MPRLTWRNAVRGPRLNGREISVIALMISFPVIGLDQFLRTASGRFSAQPYAQVEHWVTDSLIMLPLFAVGVWAGDLIASLAGVGAGHDTARRADVVTRALVISLFTGLAQVPAWFVVDRSDNPVTAQPLVAPQAHDSGDVYWVASWVVIALVCVCLAPLAVWVARAAAKAAVAQAALLLPLLAVTVLGAWALHQAAARAYASQVYYTTASTVVTRDSHAFLTAADAAAPFVFGYQAAHALQDGLAGQAAGLPVAVIALLRVARRPDDRNQHQPADT